MLIYCVTCKKKTNSRNLSGHIAENNRRYVKATCTVCGKGKTKFVSDSQIQGEGIGDLFKKVGKAAKTVGKHIVNNPTRAFKLGQQSVLATMSKNPAAMAAVAPQLAKFAVTGKGAKTGKGLYLKRQR